MRRLAYLKPHPVPPSTMAATRMAPAMEPIIRLVALGPVKEVMKEGGRGRHMSFYTRWNCYEKHATPYNDESTWNREQSHNSAAVNMTESEEGVLHASQTLQVCSL